MMMAYTPHYKEAVEVVVGGSILRRTDKSAAVAFEGGGSLVPPVMKYMVVGIPGFPMKGNLVLHRSNNPSANGYLSSRLATIG